MHWRRKWQPTPVFLPGESQGQRSLVGCCLWCRIVRHDWSDLAAAAAAAMETVTDFIFLGSKITADGDCSYEIKRHLLIGRKAMINIDTILKIRDITLPTKVCLVKAMGFLVVMYGCESWTIKKAESWRIDAFELWCWIRLLRVPWTARRSNQSILNEISPEYSLEGRMQKLKLQQFGHLMKRTDSLEEPLCWERLRAGGEGDNRGWGGWMTYWLNGHEFDQTQGDSEGQGSLV